MSTLQQQFNVLLKQFNGKEIEQIIERILESDIYITSEFLNYPNVQALGKNNKYYETLYLFSVLTYIDYKNSPSKYLTLDDNLLKKLKCISILQIAKDKKHLDYSYLKKILDIKSNFEIEEILFNLISRELIMGKIDGRNEYINIFSVKPRCNLIDFKKVEENIDKIIDNINNANEYLVNEQNQIKKVNEEVNGMLTI